MPGTQHSDPLDPFEQRLTDGLQHASRERKAGA